MQSICHIQKERFVRDEALRPLRSKLSTPSTFRSSLQTLSLLDDQQFSRSGYVFPSFLLKTYPLAVAKLSTQTTTSPTISRLTPSASSPSTRRTCSSAGVATRQTSGSSACTQCVPPRSALDGDEERWMTGRTPFQDIQQ